MFCPPGFLAFNEIVALCDEASVVAKPVYIHSEVRENDVNDHERVMEHEIFYTWLVAQCLDRFDPHVCSPSGQLFRVSGLICFHEDLISWCPWEWPTTENSRIAMAFERYRTTGEHPYLRFRFIDVITGLISVSSRKDELAKFSADGDEDIREQVLCARNFDGWSVCFPQELVPLTVPLLLNEVGYSGPFLGFSDQRGTSPPLEAKRPGRPYVQDVAAMVYWSSYPKGHGSTPSVEVEDTVSKGLGRRVSYKTISRAIRSRSDKMDKSGE